MRKGRLVTVDTPEGLQRQAMDGEVIHLQVEQSQVVESIHFLEDLPQVSRVEHVPGESDGLFVYVVDAGKELPSLLAALREQRSITPKNAEPYLPAFDEVFVRLIRKAEASQHMEVAL
jgi:ABC-type multidrug transport system ATPase subunit